MNNPPQQPQRSDMVELEYILKLISSLSLEERKSYSYDELKKMWNLDDERFRRLLRKLRREGFIKRTRRGYYKLTLAGRTLARIYIRARSAKQSEG